MWSKQRPLVMDAGQIHMICIGILWLGDSSGGECPPFTVLDTYVMRWQHWFVVLVATHSTFGDVPSNWVEDEQAVVFSYWRMLLLWRWRSCTYLGTLKVFRRPIMIGTRCLRCRGGGCWKWRGVPHGWMITPLIHIPETGNWSCHLAVTGWFEWRTFTPSGGIPQPNA